MITEFWHRKWVEAERRAEAAEAALKGFAEGRDLLRAKHVVMLGKRVRKLRRIVREMQRDAEHKNRELYATGLIVNCTGCNRGGPDRYEELTEEKVKAVERIAERLRTWWTQHNWRKRKTAAG